MRFSAATLFVTLATASAAGGANLVENPGFDDDTAEWFALFGSSILHATADELGSPASGSLQVAGLNPGQTGVAAAQCVPVVAGRTYAIGASARILEGQLVVSPRAFVSVSWSSGPACDVLDLVQPNALPYFVRLVGAWGTTETWVTAPPGAQSARFELFGGVNTNPQSQFRLLFDNAFFLEDETCGPSPTTLCLNDERFRVIVEWETKQGHIGFGHAVKLTDDSGYLWFFNDDNVEIVAKLLDACDTQFNTFWFFAAGLTNVEVTIRVHDTRTDVGRVYMNPQETPFAPIQDTDAFDTCQAIGA